MPRIEKAIEGDVYRTDPLKGEFSPTGLETFMRCPRLFFYKKALGLEPMESNLAASFGSALHVAIGNYWGKVTKATWDSVATESLGLFAEYWRANIPSLGETSKYSLPSGVRILSEYFKTYKDDLATFLPEYIETQCFVEIGKYLLVLKIDRVRKDAGGVVVVDTKSTSSSLTNYFFKKFENSFQMTAYYVGVEEVTGTVDAIQIDAIKVPYPPRASDGAFARRTFLRTDLQVHDWHNTFKQLCDYITKGLEMKETRAQLDHFYTNPTACGDFGGCPYLPVCQHGLKHPTVQVDFEKKGGCLS